VPNPATLDITALASNTGGVYNRIGRGVPDVSANGDNTATWSGGLFGLSGGTSATTPIFASIVSTRR
jgi:tripeptidyl-peptidase-1